MSFFEDNLEKIKLGSHGEQMVREYLIKKKIWHMQVDIMFKREGVWCLGEIKHQEKFVAPPYDGHGLPEWQINQRLDFQRETGVIAYLLVIDKHEECLYVNSLDNLLAGEHHKTTGKKPRVIFNINNFKRIELI